MGVTFDGAASVLGFWGIASGGTFTGGTSGVFTFAPQAGDEHLNFTVTVTDGCQLALASFAVDTLCESGLCGGLKDGVFQNPAAWDTTGGAVVSPSAAGNGNPGIGTVPGGVAGAALSQTLTVLPKSLRLRGSFDAMSVCSPPNAPDCMMMPIGPTPVLRTGDQIAFYGYGTTTGTWTTSSSCLGESAYGTDVVYSLGDAGGSQTTCWCASRPRRLRTDALSSRSSATHSQPDTRRGRRSSTQCGNAGSACLRSAPRISTRGSTQAGSEGW